MPIGFGRIIKLNDMHPVGDSAGLRAPRYQFIFNMGGNSFSKVVDEVELLDLLTEDVGLREEVVIQAIKAARDEGHATIPDLDLTENAAGAMGMQEVGSDY